MNIYEEVKKYTEKILEQNAAVNVDEIKNLVSKNNLYISMNEFLENLLLAKNVLNENIYDFLTRMLNNFHWISKNNVVNFFLKYKKFSLQDISYENSIFKMIIIKGNIEQIIHIPIIYDENIFSKNNNLDYIYNFLDSNIQKNNFYFISEDFEKAPYLWPEMSSAQNVYILQHYKYYLYYKLKEKYTDIIIF